MQKHTNLINEINIKEPTRDISFIITGAVVGLMITACAGIYLFAVVVEALMY